VYPPAGAGIPGGQPRLLASSDHQSWHSASTATPSTVGHLCGVLFGLLVCVCNCGGALPLDHDRYSWADPEYDVVHASMVPCNASFLHALRTGGYHDAENTGMDNLRTVQLVFAAYESAAAGSTVRIA
jgi:hypothetical protein